MRFRVKNLDYEILKAASERKPELMQNEINSINVMKITQKLYKNAGSELDQKYDELQQRVEALHHDGLLGRGLVNGCESNLYIRSIKPEGRALLDRMENNRFSRRLADWIMGIVAGLVLAALAKYLGIDS